MPATTESPFTLYCLMPNQVHIIATPHDLNGLHHTFERVEGITRAPFISASTRRGHLWQRRFRSSPMDESHFWAGMFMSNKILSEPSWSSPPNNGADPAHVPTWKIAPAICWTSPHGADGSLQSRGVSNLCSV